MALKAYRFQELPGSWFKYNYLFQSIQEETWTQENKGIYLARLMSLPLSTVVSLFVAPVWCCAQKMSSLHKQNACQ